ncbi:MAG: tRNA (adenosine(37)-N6)-threonylcarbamoyltransferase complex ATPase subunit type 1 TsaE [Candidatus Limnocylindria bacterium]
MDRSAAGRLESESVERTRGIGRVLGEAAEPGTVIALTGPLGAGKTQLAKGVAEGLGVTSVVNSPTFILVNEHVGRLRLFHVDAYRIDEGSEARDAGLLDERQGSGVTVIEWAERLAGWLPEERLDLAIEPDGSDADRRRLRWRARGEAHQALAGSLAMIEART